MVSSCSVDPHGHPAGVLIAEILSDLMFVLIFLCQKRPLVILYINVKMILRIWYIDFNIKNAHFCDVCGKKNQKLQCPSTDVKANLKKISFILTIVPWSTLYILNLVISKYFFFSIRTVGINFTAVIYRQYDKLVSNWNSYHDCKNHKFWDAKIILQILLKHILQRKISGKPV